MPSPVLPRPFRGVEELVVPLLEIIDVAVGHGKHLAVARRSPDLPLCELVERTPVLGAVIRLLAYSWLTPTWRCTVYVKYLIALGRTANNS